MSALHQHTPRLAPSRNRVLRPFSAAARCPNRQLALRINCKAQRERHEGSETSCAAALRVATAGVLASGLLWLTPMEPAHADVQTVPAQMVTQMARPLPKQTVDKGKVWTVFIGGAVVLFLGTLAVENNPSWFPAISRANQAMKVTAKRMQEAEEREKKEAELLKLRQEQYDAEQRQLAAVQQGLKQAKQKVLGSAPAQAPAAPAAAAPPSPPPSASTSAPIAPAAPTVVPPVLEAPVAPVAATAASVAAVAAAGAGAEQGLAAAHAAAGAPVAHASSNGTAGADADAEAEAGAGAASSVPYVVVQEAVPDIGAVAWSSGAGAGSANGSGQGGAAPSDAEAQEALARAARLQSFVSETVAGSKSALEALKAKRQ